MERFSHTSVMLYEAVDGLAIKPGGIYVDGTAGGGGHSLEIAKRLTGGRLIAIDRDSEAVKAAGERLKEYPNATVVKGCYSSVRDLLDGLGIDKIDGMLLDLGVSSYQLDTAGRGFSYTKEAELDMRMDKSGGITASDVVNTYSREALAKIFFDYGEERYANRIAFEICKERERGPIRTTTELAEIIKNAMPAAARSEKGHPAKRCFQALRIEVNNELGELREGLESAFDLLKPGGRLAVITFHSLEDRMVKNFFRDKATGCICPKDFPICVCGHKPEAQVITRKAVLPSKEEQQANPRSKSAKLRIAEKLAAE